MSASKFDILVVGAGPVGLAAAIAFAKDGRSVALVSPRRPSDERTSALLVGSVSLLKDIGVWPDIEPHAAPLRSLRIVDATRRLVRSPEVVFHAAEIELDAFGFNVPNVALLSALERGAATAAIERMDDAVHEIRVAADCVVAKLAGSGREISSGLIVAADGARSRVREAAGIEVETRRHPQSALVASLRHELAHDDTSTEFHTENGPFTLVPLPGNRSSLVWVDRPAENARRAALAVDALSAEIEERAGAFPGVTTVEGPGQVFPLMGQVAHRLIAKRVALAGEAGHVLPPIGAQGLNLGYRDISALRDVLAGTDDPGAAAILEAYDRARRADVRLRDTAVDLFNLSLLSDFLPMQLARSLGLGAADQIPPLRRALMRAGAGLPLNGAGVDR